MSVGAFRTVRRVIDTNSGIVGVLRNKLEIFCAKHLQPTQLAVIFLSGFLQCAQGRRQPALGGLRRYTRTVGGNFERK